MSIDDLHALLEQAFPKAYIDVKHSGNHYSITVVDDVFVGKKTVQRQQLVYSVLQKEITSGSIHAVQIKTYSNQEWQQYISDLG